MGAMPWQEMAPWNPDPNAALEELQVELLLRNYDLPSLLKQWVESARQAVELTEADGDRFNILQLYRNDLAAAEEAAQRGVPSDPRDQITLVRQMHGIGGEGVGNVLDLTSVSDEGGFFIARRLREDELIRVFGTVTPTRAMAEQAFGMLYRETGRGESFCFPVFDETGNPIGWWFAGYSMD